MSITGQRPLTNIAQAKEQTVSFQSLALVQIEMNDGSFRYYSSENLDSTMDGVQYAGHDWRPRIMEESLGSLSSVSDTGIITLPQISLKLADGDKEIWLNDEVNGPGYNGGKLKLIFVFWDADNETFSEDFHVKFVGICNSPNADHNSVTLTVANILNLQNINLPTAQISQTCIWSFPPDHASRVQAAYDPLSVFYQCHYSVDVTDADVPNGTKAARGNLDPSTNQPYLQCDYTRAGCIARMGDIGLPDNSSTVTFNMDGSIASGAVQIEQDTTGRRTGTFGGITFNPPYDWRGRQYVSGQKQQNINDPNDAKYSGYFPLQYGAGFATPPVMNVEGDPNSTRFEVVLAAGLSQQIWGDFGSPGPITLVIVNDFVVPFRLQSNDPSILGWSWINGGSVNGLCTRDALFNGRGDPYGSMVALEIVVPIEVQASNSIPSVQIIWGGQPVVVYTDPMTLNITATENPAWGVYDILTTYCNLTNDDLDVTSFISAAPVCDDMVTYTDLTGNTGATHARYRLGEIISRRRSAQDVLNNVLASFKAQLAFNAGVDPTTTGKLQLFIKQTLADQQPAPVYGSNDTMAYPSATAEANSDENDKPILDGTGYVAYHFRASDILRSGPDRNSPSTFTIEQRTIADCPDKISVSFQDENYQYTQDSLTIVDPQRLARTNQIINGGLSLEGIVNYDQAQRAIETQFAEQYRGNPRSGRTVLNGVPQNDPGGTWIANFKTTFKAAHLRVGHIVAITYADWGLDAQFFRVLSISASMNCEEYTIRAQWHEDEWYLDTYGQNPNPILQAQLANKTARPPYGWLPNVAAPLSSDPIVPATEKTFALAQQYIAAADQTALATLAITGCEPVNNFNAKTSPPFAPVLEAEISGGTVPDGYYYSVLVAVDGDGNTTAPSNPVSQVHLVGSTGHGTLTVPNIFWQSGTAAWKVYAGTNPNRLSLQATGSGTPTSITLTSFVFAGEGLPDVNFNNLEVRVTPVVHSGILGVAITDLTSTTFSIDALPGVDLTGKVASVIGIANSGSPLPILDFLISGNSSNVLTIGGGAPDLTTLGIKVGSVLVVRANATTVSDTTIGDALFVNDVDYFAPPITIVDATNASPIVVETNINHNYANGDTVQVSSVLGNLGANIKTTITVIDARHFSLTGSVGTGPYNGGGVTQQQTSGLVPHTEEGLFVYILRGTGAGQWRKIVDNDETTYTIDNKWAILPDATSEFIVTQASVVQTADTNKIINSSPTTQTTMKVPVPNYLGQVLWVQVFTESATGQYSVITDSPGREIYIFGGPGTAVVQYDKATFNISVSADLITGDDICVPYLVRRPGTPVDCSALIQNPSVGADILLDVEITKADASYTGTIFASSPGITLPAGSTATIDLTSFLTGMHFDQGDLLTINCTQVGTSQPGRGVVIVIKFKLD